jgi:hypothetical protein
VGKVGYYTEFLQDVNFNSYVDANYQSEGEVRLTYKSSEKVSRFDKKKKAAAPSKLPPFMMHANDN